MKRGFYTFLFLIIGLHTMGQNIRISANTGYGFYKMSDLKGFQSDMIKYFYPLPIKAVQQFPPYFNYSTSLEYYFTKSTLFGIKGAFYTTGGRNHLKDYSGEYKMDMLINGYLIGLQFRQIIASINKFRFYAQLNSGIIFSFFNIKESMVVHYANSISNNSIFRSKTFYGEPNVGITYSIEKKYSIDFCIGYQVDIKSKLFYNENHNFELYSPNGSNVFVDWSGLKILLGVSYDF